MNLKIIMPSEKDRPKRLNDYIYANVQKRPICRDKKSVSGCQGLGGRVTIWAGVSFQDERNVLKTDCGDGYTIV